MAAERSKLKATISLSIFLSTRAGTHADHRISARTRPPPSALSRHYFWLTKTRARFKPHGGPPVRLIWWIQLGRLPSPAGESRQGLMETEPRRYLLSLFVHRGGHPARMHCYICGGFHLDPQQWPNISTLRKAIPARALTRQAPWSTRSPNFARHTKYLAASSISFGARAQAHAR